MDATMLYELGVALVFIGMAIIAVAIFLLLLSSARNKGETRGAGAIIIGFIPIVFGTDKDMIKKVLLLSLLLTVCLLYTSPSPRDRTRSRMPSSA